MNFIRIFLAFNSFVFLCISERFESPWELHSAKKICQSNLRCTILWTKALVKLKSDQLKWQGWESHTITVQKLFLIFFPFKLSNRYDSNHNLLNERAFFFWLFLFRFALNELKCIRFLWYVYLHYLFRSEKSRFHECWSHRIPLQNQTQF